MIPRRIRIVLIILLAAYGVVCLLGGRGIGWLYLSGAGLFALGLRSHSSVWAAYQALTRGNTTLASSRIAEVKDPSSLTDQDRAYYYWIVGNIALGEQRHADAYHNLSLVESGRLRTSHIQAATECALAEAAFGLQNVDTARIHLLKARQLPHRSSLDPALASLTERVGSA